jgi:hypothetical protein
MAKPIYRPVLQKAWQIVWQRKFLWLLGIFAGVINTGAVLEVGFRALQPVNTSLPVGQMFVSNIIPGLDIIQLYLTQFFLMSPTRAWLTLGVLFVLGVVFVMLAVLAQGGIIEGALARKKHRLADLKKAEHAFWKVLLIDIATKTLVALLLALSVTPLALLSATVFNQMIASAVTLIVFILAILIISLISIFAITAIVHRKYSIAEAIAESIEIFRKYPVVILEVAVLLFLIQLIGAGLIGFVLLMVWLPYTLIFMLTTLIPVTILSSVISMFVTIVALILVLTISGLLVAYQYTVWALVYEKLRTRGMTAKWHRFKKDFRLF